MPTTIRDLLEDRDLRLGILVDGDLDRPLRWVHVTELVDASAYLAGNELILTAGVWLRRGVSPLGFVRALEKKSVAGIGYGLLDAGEVVPRGLARACRDEGVPLLLVPVETPFIAITQRFVQRLSEEREADLRRSLAFTSRLIAAADTPDLTAAMGAIARVLRRDADRDVWIADAGGRLLASAGRKPDGALIRAAAARVVVGQAADPQAGVVVTLRNGPRVSALIGMASGGGPDLEIRARLEMAVPVVALVRARERAVRETERRLAGELVSLVLSRQFEAAAVRMTSYGLDPYRPVIAIVASVPEEETALSGGELWLDQRGLVGIVALRGSELYVVLDGALPMPVEAREMAESLVAQVGAAAAGIGAAAGDVTGLRKSMVQARQACELGLRRGGGTVVSHEMAGSHSLLLALQDQDVLDDFRDTLLTPLEEHDAKHAGDLVASLRTFLACGGRWQPTASALTIHVNTLRHRLARVEELTGRRLDDTSDRVDLWLALQTPPAGRPTPRGKAL